MSPLQQQDPPLSYTIVNPTVLPSAVSTSTTPTPTISYSDICNVASTIKAIWAFQKQQECSVSSSVPFVLHGRRNDTNSFTSLDVGFSNDSSKSVLTNIPGHVNSNTMAYTIDSGLKKPQFVVDQCYVDDYCEYEQNELQYSIYHKIIVPILTNKSSTEQQTGKEIKSIITSICQRLETAIGQPGNMDHFVFYSTITLADIAIATTLWQFIQFYAHCTGTATASEKDGDIESDSSKYNKILDELFTKPVQKYLTFHHSSYIKAFSYAKQLQVEQQSVPTAVASKGTTNHDDLDSIIKGTPSFMKVVDVVFRNAVQQLFGHYNIALPKIIVKPCSNPKHGDFQFSAAMPIYAAISKDTTTTADPSKSYNEPIDIANAIVQHLGTEHPVLTDITTQGPGFILCRLSIQYLQYHMNQYLMTKKLCMPTTSNTDMESESKVCVVDFSSPNIAKEMHVGHLRSTIIGECICRILEAMPNYIVHRVNHVGDWGTQFGMLIQYLKEEYPHIVQDIETDTNGNRNPTTITTKDLPNITDLTQFYKNAKQRFDENPEFKKIAQLNVVKLQSGDAECLYIWKLLCDISRLEFQKVYERLDVSCVECGESFYNDKIAPVIDEFTAANMIQIEEGGAKCVFVPKFTIPLMLQKSDGGYGYDSTDMAALKYRLHDLKANRVIYITDFTQGDHFKMVFLAGEQIGWIDQGQQLQHIGFGTVQGEDGKRFKTRSGDTVRLVDLLDEAVYRMENELRTRIEEGKANITLEELHEVAEAIGYGAVKYFDLRRNPTSNYKFSYDQMLDTKGDTAVYLLYTRVRLESIVAKAATEHNVVVDELIKNNVSITMTHACERNLALQLLNFTDVMETTLEDLYPYHICEYVYKVATAASDFVTQCRVLGSDEMESRILLCHVTTNAMRYCFDLLGIRHVKRI